MDIEEYVKKCNLNDEELEKFYEKWGNRDHSLDHKMAARTLTSQIRREIMRYIGYNVRTTEEIKEKFGLEDDQVEFHLNMLEQPSYAMDCDGNWKLTPRGIAFLENAKIDD
ncbi:MAG: ArsR family transcriptional regulator [Promethearchaeota archaeon]|nr:MAG: ArsR family transcriptional regulator [Candidatus Lokiarchaeota archaeon]